ncbi:DUF3987 domain-containing protein [Saccharopolyspora spinosporotrichia]
MARMRREGNTLSATLRAAWEGGNLSTLGVTARIVRDAHVGILTHITPGEFHAKVSHSDMAGGTYNRFLPVFVAQTQFLPAGTGADPALIERLAVDLRARLDQGATLGQLGFSDEAAYLWRRLYVEFGGFSTEDGPIEQFLSRAAPNCLRVAGIHAALDGTPTIQPAHLVAAAAFIRYAVDSARAVFRQADPALAQLAAYIREAGPQGRTRTEITAGFFQGNARKTRIEALLDQLIADHTIAKTQRRPEGRKEAAPPRSSLPTNTTNLRTMPLTRANPESKVRSYELCSPRNPRSAPKFVISSTSSPQEPPCTPPTARPPSRHREPGREPPGRQGILPTPFPPPLPRLDLRKPHNRERGNAPRTPPDTPGIRGCRHRPPLPSPGPGSPGTQRGCC